MGGGGRELLRVEDNGEAELMHQPYWIISKSATHYLEVGPGFTPPD